MGMKSKKHEKLVRALDSWEIGLARIGECVVQFQRIEDAMTLCIAALIGRDRTVGEIVAREISFRAKLSVFSALFFASAR